MINDYFDDRNGVDAINTPSKVTTFALCPCHLDTCHASFKTMRCLFTAALTEECRYTRDHAVSQLWYTTAGNDRSMYLCELV